MTSTELGAGKLFIRRRRDRMNRRNRLRVKEPSRMVRCMMPSRERAGRMENLVQKGVPERVRGIGKGRNGSGSSKRTVSLAQIRSYGTPAILSVPILVFGKSSESRMMLHQERQAGQQGNMWTFVSGSAFGSWDSAPTRFGEPIYGHQTSQQPGRCLH